MKQRTTSLLNSSGPLFRQTFGLSFSYVFIAYQLERSRSSLDLFGSALHGAEPSDLIQFDYVELGASISIE